MPLSKQIIEQECQNLLLQLETLTKDRHAIHDEFSHLTQLHKNLVVQLRTDSFAGEGQLHAFQVEKCRIEDRLEELEQQLKEKNDLVTELDNRASEYLLSVTSESNTLYDEDDTCEQNPEQKNLIQKLVYDELIESNEIAILSKSKEYLNRNSDSDDASNEETGSITESLTQSKPSKGEELSDNDAPDNILNEDTESKNYDQNMKPENDSTQNENKPEEISSLKTLLAELKSVKSEIGKVITVKDQSSLDIEDQLLSTRQELAFLRETMSKMTDALQWKESMESLYQSNDKLDRQYSSEGEGDDEEEDSYAEEMIGMALNDLRDSDELDGSDRALRRQSESSRRYLPLTPRSSSVSSSISGKVAMLEMQLKEAYDRADKYNRKVKHLVKDRESKQYECDILKRKVHQVEAKMSALQDTFDQMAKLIANERDELLKKLEEKSKKISELEKEIEKLKSGTAFENSEQYKELQRKKSEYESKIQNLESKCLSLDKNHKASEETHNNEIKEIKESYSESFKTFKANIASLQNERKDLRSKCDKLESESQQTKETSNQQKDEITSLKERLDDVNSQLQDKSKLEEGLRDDLIQVKHSLRDKELELKEADDKIISLQKEIDTKVNEIREELAETQSSKAAVDCQLNNEVKAKLENTIEKLKEEIAELSSKNLSLILDMEGKDSASKEELNMREATIKELEITLTKNQKQSRENYQMVKNDLELLKEQYNQDKEENKVIITHLKNKCMKLETDVQQKEEQCLVAKKELEELKEKYAKCTENEPPSKVDQLTQESFKESSLDKENIIKELQEKIFTLETSIEQRKSPVPLGEDQDSAMLSRFETQLLQIKKLNDCLDEIKKELNQSVNECSTLKEKVKDLNNEKSSLQNENLEIVKKLQEQLSIPENKNEHSEEKKNFA